MGFENAKPRPFFATSRFRVLNLPALAAPGAVLAALLVGLAGFAIGLRSGSQDRSLAAWMPPHGATVSSGSAHWRTSRGTRPAHGIAIAPPPVRGVQGTELPTDAPITPPEAVWRGPEAAESTSSPGRAGGADPLATADRQIATGASGAGTAGSAGSAPRPSASRKRPAAAPNSPGGPAPSAEVVEALQASVEETTRQRIADEVALLAQELNQAEAHTSDFFGPSGPGEPS
jgi:hypothetical protein